MREIVHMRLSGEFSFAEIGEILGKSENWARVTFYRAKQKIMSNTFRYASPAELFMISCPLRWRILPQLIWKN